MGGWERFRIELLGAADGKILSSKIGAACSRWSSPLSTYNMRTLVLAVGFFRLEATTATCSLRGLASKLGYAQHNVELRRFF